MEIWRLATCGHGLQRSSRRKWRRVDDIKGNCGQVVKTCEICCGQCALCRVSRCTRTSLYLCLCLYPCPRFRLFLPSSIARLLFGRSVSSDRSVIVSPTPPHCNPLRSVGLLLLPTAWETRLPSPTDQRYSLDWSVGGLPGLYTSFAYLKCSATYNRNSICRLLQRTVCTFTKRLIWRHFVRTKRSRLFR